MPSTELTVANTIRDQIGRPALVMLGASNFIGSENSLSFKIQGSRVTHIRIVLEPTDTYRVEFFRCRGTARVTIAESNGVYVDSLHGLIESKTGLRLQL